MSLQMVMFAYLGVEMIGLTAGEAKNPQKTIPSAIGSVFWRVTLPLLWPSLLAGALLIALHMLVSCAICAAVSATPGISFH